MEATLFKRCESYLRAQATMTSRERSSARLAITISREAGAGAITTALHLADYLEKHKIGSDAPWVVFDQNLIQKVLSEHMLPHRMETFMPEDATSTIRDAVEEVLGLHPASWTLVQRTFSTVTKLAQCGNAIIVGRGGNLIAGNMKHVFHVRLVAPYEERIMRIQKYYSLDYEKAAEFIKNTDTARMRYLKQNFGADIENPNGYHLIVNTGRLHFKEAGRIIGDAAAHLTAYEDPILSEVSA